MTVVSMWLKNRWQPMAADKYQLNAFLAFPLALLGFIACIFVGALTRFFLPQPASVLVALSLMVSLLAFVRSKVTITPGSQKSLRFVGIVIGIAAIIPALVVMIYNYNNFAVIRQHLHPLTPLRTGWMM